MTHQAFTKLSSKPSTTFSGNFAAPFFISLLTQQGEMEESILGNPSQQTIWKYLEIRTNTCAGLILGEAFISPYSKEEIACGGSL